MTTLYFIRHGQASFGAANYDKLSPTGELQAVVLGEYLKQILKQAPVVYAGSMQRHLETANLSLASCFPNVEIVQNSAWNEFNHQQVFSRYEPRYAQADLLKHDVALEANPRAYLEKIFTGAIARWTGGEFDHEYDESWPAFQHRINQAFEELCATLAQTSPRYAVIYTSGGVISMLMAKLLGLTHQKTFDLNWNIANGSISSVRLIHAVPQLLSFNEHHFIKAKNPQLLTWI